MFVPARVNPLSEKPTAWSAIVTALMVKFASRAGSVPGDRVTLARAST